MKFWVGIVFSIIFTGCFSVGKMVKLNEEFIESVSFGKLFV